MTSRPGDWICSKCGKNNFARRDVCFSCSQPKDPTGAPQQPAPQQMAPQPGVAPAAGEQRPGDWFCVRCNGLNFSRRVTCFSCGAPKDAGAAAQMMGMWPQQQPVGLPGDWVCPRCGYNNFARRTTCMRCNEPAPGRGFPAPAQFAAPFAAPQFAAPQAFPATNVQQRPGDWYCPQCGNLNFSRRDSCHRCNQPRPAEAGVAMPAQAGAVIPRPGDWVCPKCNFTNFARRTTCKECNTPHEDPAAAAAGAVVQQAPPQPTA